MTFDLEHDLWPLDDIYQGGVWNIEAISTLSPIPEPKDAGIAWHTFLFLTCEPRSSAWTTKVW